MVLVRKYAGLPKQEKLSDFMKIRRKRAGENELLRYYLRHRRKEFHHADFNFVVNNMLMRHKVFQNTRLQCNLRFEDAKSMGEKFGEMYGHDLNESIKKARASVASTAYTTADQFLTSISSICRHLPHSNDASSAARNDYYAMLVNFGLPALFVTISPDDQRSLWIKVHLLKDPKRIHDPERAVNELSENDMVELYRERVSIRSEYPGLCAEDYIAIVETFIRDILRWDTENETAFGEGLFGVTEGFTGATEEKGRKRG